MEIFEDNIELEDVDIEAKFEDAMKLLHQGYDKLMSIMPLSVDMASEVEEFYDLLAEDILMPIFNGDCDLW